jgi:hypothetical protein
MKQITILFLAIICFSKAFSAPIDSVVVNNGKWNLSTSWSLGRLPQNGDTVIIPEDIILLIDNNVNLSTSQLYIKVKGTLTLKVGKLDINSASTVVIYNTGSINNSNGNNSERIQIGSVIKYSGSNGTLFGPSMANSSTSSAPDGFSSFSILPVKFLSFGLTRTASDVLVQWATSEEENAGSFIVERSQDGTSWSSLGTVAAAGTSRAINNYSFSDRSNNLALAYYRIRQMDVDGRASYTAVKSIKSQSSDSQVKIAATTGAIVLQFPALVKGQAAVVITGTNGQVVARQLLSQPVGQVLIPAAASLHGLYIVSVQQEQGVSSTQVLL